MKIQLCSVSMLALIIALDATTAMAQEPASQESRRDALDGGGASAEEIIVTARRKGEALQNTPVAVTAFSQDSIDQKGIRTPLELSKSVPGLQAVTTPGQSTNISFAIRGRGTNANAAAGSVETYFADVPLSPPFQRPTLPVQFFDLASFQVLKGPQGTLFGRSTTGGAVLIVPAAPSTDGIEGYARLQGGNYDNVQAEAAINLPLGDKAALRLAGFAWHRKGYNRTIGGATDPFGKVLPSQRVDNQDVYELRASLLLQPTDGLTNTTIFTYHADKNRGTMTTVALRAGTFGLSGDPNRPVPPTAIGLPAVGPHLLDSDVDLSRGWSSTFAIVNTTTLDLTDNLTLKNIFGYINAKDYSDGPLDADGTRLTAIDIIKPARRLKNEQITNELQLQGSLADGKVEFLAGGLIDLTRNPGGRDDINIYLVSYPNGGLGFSSQFLQSDYTAKSLFGSATGHLTDKLALTVGARYSHEKVVETRADLLELSSPSSAVPATVPFQTDRATFNGWSYNAGLEYKAGSDTLIYGGYRRGWKRGGFNPSPPSPAQAFFRPEKDDDFYLGLKQDLGPLGLKGHFNIEGFYDFYHGAQNSYLTITSTGLSVVVDNAEKQTFRGFDMDFEIRTTNWLDLMGNYTFVDARINKWTDRSLTDPTALATLADPSTDLSANPLPYVSKHKFSLSARLHRDLGDGSEIVAIPTVSYQSKFYNYSGTARVTNSAAYLFLGGQQLNMAQYGVGVIPAYTLADFRIEWNHIKSSNVDVAINVNNLFGKNYYAGGNAGVYLFGFDQRVWGPPRMVTAEAKIRF